MLNWTCSLFNVASIIQSSSQNISAINGMQHHTGISLVNMLTGPLTQLMVLANHLVLFYVGAMYWIGCVYFIAKLF